MVGGYIGEGIREVKDEEGFRGKSRDRGGTKALEAQRGSGA